MNRELLFKRMFQEEWRMHTELFGTLRFAAFPVFIALLTALGIASLTITGISLEPLLIGLHVMVLLFGLQTGSLAFIGNDALRNVLGDTTYLIFSARTLPISRTTLLQMFLLKDLVYYAIFFLLPITLGFLPALAATGYSLPATTLSLLWFTLTLMFMLGVGITMTVLSLTTNGSIGKLIVGMLTIGAIAAGTTTNLLSYTPYALLTAPAPLDALKAIILVPIFLITAVTIYSPNTTREARTRTNTYTSLRKRPPFDTPLVAKMLVDLQRSSGGLAKVLFSGGILLAVAWFLLQLATDIIGLEPSIGIAYGSLLSLTAFTTYNWITQNDDADEYTYLPIDIADIFDAKLNTFVLLTALVGVVFYGCVALLEGTALTTILTGALVFTGLSFYLFGLTVYLAGFSPNDFLFDTVLFMAFTAAVIVVFVPIILVAFIMQPLTPVVLAVIAIGTTLTGLVGMALYTRAIPKWTTRIRNG